MFCLKGTGRAPGSRRAAPRGWRRACGGGLLVAGFFAAPADAQDIQDVQRELRELRQHYDTELKRLRRDYEARIGRLEKQLKAAAANKSALTAETPSTVAAPPPPSPSPAPVALAAVGA